MATSGAGATGGSSFWSGFALSPRKSPPKPQEEGTPPVSYLGLESWPFIARRTLLGSALLSKEQCSSPWGKTPKVLSPLNVVNNVLRRASGREKKLTVKAKAAAQPTSASSVSYISSAAPVAQASSAQPASAKGKATAPAPALAPPTTPKGKALVPTNLLSKGGLCKVRSGLVVHGYMCIGQLQ